MKGLGYLIKALAEIKKENHPPLKLLVLGRDRRGPYLRLAKKMGISEGVLFAGSTDEPEKYYGAADLLVHPTFYDACSLTVLEALSSGLPVVTSSYNGASGMIRQQREGFVIQEPRNIDELRGAIKHFFNDEVRNHASHEGRVQAEAYSQKVNFDHVKGLLTETLRYPDENEWETSKR
jgi:UDP-glucose:(heptosyl)LPS alpha-1,3-glucosyltransferase